jgi:stage V sporulation protein G
MTITEVNIVPVKPDNGLVAFASCVIHDRLYIGSIGVFTKLSGGYRLVYPTKKVGERHFHYFHPISKQAAQELDDAILPHVQRLFRG